MNLECSAGIAKIAIKAKEENGIVTRTVRMTLVREFDALIARAIGGDAKDLLESLRSKSCVKVEIALDGVIGNCKLDGEKGDSVVIKGATGVKAIGKVAKKEDEDPKIELVFEFPFLLAAWTFFGQNVGSRATLLFTKQQLDLPQTEKKPRKQKFESLAGGSNGAPVDGVADHVAEEQAVAETPDEAEELRGERLAKEEADRQAEIDRLAAEQARDGAKDGPRALLKAPKKKTAEPEPAAPTDDDDIAF